MSWILKNKEQTIVEKVTDANRISSENDLEEYLQISDGIKAAKYSHTRIAKVISQRLKEGNPWVQLSSLNLLDFCAKNAGIAFVKEVTSYIFVDDLVKVLKKTDNLDVKNGILRFVALWGSCAERRIDLAYIRSIYESLIAEDYKFPHIPQPEINQTVINPETAPEWDYNKECSLCKTGFTLTFRQHHCRNCGKSFCSDCSNRFHEIPKYGFNEPVRVCLTCYPKLESKAQLNEYPTSTNEEERQLQLALELSAKEFKEPKESKKHEINYTLGKNESRSSKCDEIDKPRLNDISQIRQILPQLKLAIQNRTISSIDYRSLGDYLNRLEDINAKLSKKSARLKAKISDYQSQLEEIDALEEVWNSLIDGETRKMDGMNEPLGPTSASGEKMGVSLDDIFSEAPSASLQVERKKSLSSEEPDEVASLISL